MADSDDKTIAQYSQKWWAKELLAAEKALDDKWRVRGDKVVSRYLDEREGGSDEARSKYNIFWANVEIMKAALYAQPPKPHVTRQFGDDDDDIARVGALIMERLLQIGLSKDQSDMHHAFELAVEDRLVPGMGQVWLRYDVDVQQEPVTDPVTGQPMVGEDGKPVTQEKIVWEDVITEHLYWRDFLWSPARTWNEVHWVAKRAWLSEKAFTRRFGKDKYKDLKNAAEHEHRDGDQQLPKGFIKGKCEVWEIWCKESNKVYWINRAFDQMLDEKDDPLGLDDFFPCPRPLLATHTTNNLAPVPDYCMVQDQYEELDTLNSRIDTLTSALRVVGVYDKNNAEVGQMFAAGEMRMIPVENWAMLAEKGGLKGAVDWFPVDQVAKVLGELSVQREATINQIYQLTSISDIMRGVSQARETARAQTLKAQYSSVRLQLTQRAVARFVQHALRIKAEIIAKHFQPETIATRSNIQFSQSAQFAQPAIELLKDWRGEMFRVEITEESLSMADYNAEREMRVEYLTAVGQFLSQAGPMMEFAPNALPYLIKMIKWTTSAFRGSSDIETVLDQAAQAAFAAPPTSGEGGPDPMAQAQADTTSAQAKAQGKAMENQSAAQLDNVKTQNKTKLAVVNTMTKMMTPQPPNQGGTPQ